MALHFNSKESATSEAILAQVAALSFEDLTDEYARNAAVVPKNESEAVKQFALNEILKIELRQRAKRNTDHNA